jgi:hypothetical protein
VRTSRARRPAISREELLELRRMLDAYAETAGIAPEDGGIAPEAERPEPVPEPAPEPTPEPPPEPRPEPTPPRTPVEYYDDLESEEVISLLGSLEREDLELLRRYERDHRARASVLGAIDSVLARVHA